MEVLLEYLAAAADRRLASAPDGAGRPAAAWRPVSRRRIRCAAADRDVEVTFVVRSSRSAASWAWLPAPPSTPRRRWRARAGAWIRRSGASGSRPCPSVTDDAGAAPGGTVERPFRMA
jgi:hypothetical protein